MEGSTLLLSVAAVAKEDPDGTFAFISSLTCIAIRGGHWTMIRGLLPLRSPETSLRIPQTAE